MLGPRLLHTSPCADTRPTCYDHLPSEQRSGRARSFGSGASASTIVALRPICGSTMTAVAPDGSQVGSTTTRAGWLEALASGALWGLGGVLVGLALGMPPYIRRRLGGTSRRGLLDDQRVRASLLAVESGRGDRPAARARRSAGQPPGPACLCGWPLRRPGGHHVPVRRLPVRRCGVRVCDHRSLACNRRPARSRLSARPSRLARLAGHRAKYGRRNPGDLSAARGRSSAFRVGRGLRAGLRPRLRHRTDLRGPRHACSGRRRGDHPTHGFLVLWSWRSSSCRCWAAAH